MTSPERRATTISTKLTDAEFVAITDAAAREGESVSSWARRALMATVRETDPGDVIIAEVLALRVLLLNLLAPLHRDTRLSGEQIHEVIARADTEKAARAAEILHK